LLGERVDGERREGGRWGRFFGERGYKCPGPDRAVVLQNLASRYQVVWHKVARAEINPIAVMVISGWLADAFPVVLLTPTPISSWVWDADPSGTPWFMGLGLGLVSRRSDLDLEILRFFFGTLLGDYLSVFQPRQENIKPSIPVVRRRFDHAPSFQVVAS